MGRKRKHDSNGEDRAAKHWKLNAPPKSTLKSKIESSQTLLCYYKHVLTLRDFLLARLPSKSRVRSKRIRTCQVVNLLGEHVVGILDTPSQDEREKRKQEFVAFTQTQYSMSRASGLIDNVSMSEIVDFVVWLLFQKSSTSSFRPQNILCHGLQRATASSNQTDKELYVPGIVRQHPNDSFDAFKSSTWAQLASLLGDSAESILTSLLLDCAIFKRLSTGKDNYYQMSGIPLAQLSKLEHGDNKISTENNRSRQHLKPRSIDQITFVRNRIFYAKPSLTRDGNVLFGLKHIHALNRYSKPSSIVHRVFLLKYVFPRQFGLHNAFTSEVDSKETTQPFKDYTLREHEIRSQTKRAGTWIQRRLRGPVETLITKIQCRHNKCPYAQLLRHYCPTRPKGTTLVPTLRYVTSASLSSSADYLRAQKRLDIPSLSTPDDHKETMDRCSDDSMLGYATPVSQVSAFCQSVFRHLLPTDVFGRGCDGVKNFATVLRVIDTFVRMGRHESMTMGAVSHNILIRIIDWLRPSSIPSEARMSSTDHEKRKELLNEFLYYIYDSLLIPLIRSNFYVTETGIHRNRLFYFRHDVWRKITEPTLATLRLTMFSPIHNRELRSTQTARTLGHSHLRLLPKDRGARPIMNLRRKPMKVVNNKRLLGLSVNAQLLPVFSVLKYEGTRKSELLDPAMLSVRDIHNRLTAFKESLGSFAQPLYFVKVDVKSCFDTIPQARLLKWVVQIFSQKQYRTTRVLQAKTNLQSSKIGEKQVSRRFIGVAQSADDKSVFSIAAAEDLANQRKHVVFTDTGNQRIWQASQILKLLQEHVQNNIVKIGRNHFRQKEGIPQGSILSSLLCTLFYTEFQKTHLDFLEVQSSLLLRLIDDFLLISTDQDHAKRFVQIMANGATDYGISIRPEKSLANFEMSANGHKIPTSRSNNWFSYCGLQINMQNLAISKDREKKDRWIGNSITVDTSNIAVKLFHRRITTALKLQLQAMLLDQQLNGREQVLSNLMGCFMETAMKMHRYVVSIPCSKRMNDQVVINLIKTMIEICIRMTRRRGVETQGGVQPISRTQICWLASTAMLRVLERKQSRYGHVLEWLHELNKNSSSSMRPESTLAARIIADNVQLFKQDVY